MRLSGLTAGEKGVIVKVRGHGGFRKRIVEMGFIKGKTVEVLLNAPLKDPIKYKVMGYEISLRRQEAGMIEILSEHEAKEQVTKPNYHPGMSEDIYPGEEELKRIGKQLRAEEEDLTKYNVQKRIINYLDETKEIAAISKEFELREQDALFAFNSTASMLKELEKHMDSNARQVLRNMEFVDKLREASNITGKISEAEAMTDSNKKDLHSLEGDKKRLNELKQELNALLRLAFASAAGLKTLNLAGKSNS